MVNVDVFDHLGPIWARVDPLDHFEQKMIFGSKAPPPNPTLSLWGNKLNLLQNSLACFVNIQNLVR